MGLAGHTVLYVIGIGIPGESGVEEKSLFHTSTQCGGLYIPVCMPSFFFLLYELEIHLAIVNSCALDTHKASAVPGGTIIHSVGIRIVRQSEKKRIYSR